ncbi:MAG: hypothetical protein K2J71_03315 [Oscillospiraceae bacterium]|nr:hypothetical protein [Oscillospiraceae bacterium]
MENQEKDTNTKKSPAQVPESYTRMCTKDMLQYCEETLAWEEFGAVDIFFFESVKKILLGQCPDVQISESSENSGNSES